MQNKTSESLKKARAACAKMRLDKEVKYLDPIEKSKLDPRSLRKASAAKCWDCIGRGYDPNPRREIACCPSVDCPLHHQRPYQNLLNRKKEV